MRGFTKTLKRAVTIKSADPALGNATFTISMDSLGLSVRREGARKDTTRKLTWRSIVGYALVYTKTGG